MAQQTEMGTALASPQELGTEFVRLERQGPIAWCTIDRPSARNALTPNMYRAIGRALAISTDSPDIGALILTGTESSFISGGDLGGDGEEAQETTPSRVLPFNAIRNSRIPIVTAINGICQASGLLMAMLSDVAVASSSATFRAPELLRGFTDMWYAAVLPAHIGVGRAREFMLTARKVDASESLTMGLIERVVEPSEFPAAAEAAAYEILETAPAARKAWKQAVNARYGVVDELVMDEAVESAEAQEGFSAFLEKRPPAWSYRSSNRVQRA